MEIESLVAGPSVGEVDAELMADGGDVFFAHVDEGAQDLHVGIGASRDRLRHGGEKVFAAIRIDGVVARVCGDDETFCSNAFGKASGDREQDAIAEGHHSAFHVFFFVVPLGDFATGLEEVALEEVVHKGEVGDLKRDSRFLSLPTGHGEFLGVVLGGVIDAEASDHFVTLSEGVPEGDGGIHTAGEKEDRLHGFDREKRMSVCKGGEVL